MFCAESECADEPGACKQRNAAAGKAFRTCTGKRCGQLQNQIRSMAQRPACAGKLIERGRIPTLHEAAAHGYDRMRTAGKPLRAGKMVCMPVVKRIVFCDNADRVHGVLPKKAYCSMIIA